MKLKRKPPDGGTIGQAWKEVTLMQKRGFKITVKPPYITGAKHWSLLIQPVLTKEDGFYVWLAKIFGLALLAESAEVAILFLTI